MATQSSPFLQKILLFDAGTCVLMGLVMALGAEVLESPLGLQITLIRYSGISLIPFALLLLYLGTRQVLMRSAIMAVIVGNIAWAVLSILIIVVGIVSPTFLGEMFVIGQGIAVAVLAELEFLGLRKSQSVAV